MNTTISGSTTSRFEFIDLLRGWAVFVMIETHVVNAILLPELKEQPLFKALTFINGLVAPSFLFCAGMALALTLQRKWADYVNMKQPLGRYLIRLLFILVVGYSLHLPFFSLARLRALTDEQAWIPFYQVDILQTIASSLFFLTMLAVFTRRQTVFIWMATVISAIIIFSSPIIRQMDHTGLPVWFRPYLTTQFKSQFPLFPWMAFLSSGMLIGFWFLQMKTQGKERAFINQLLFFSFAAIGISCIAEILPLTIYPHHDFWRASPEFFFVRLGCVTLFLCLLWLYEQQHAVSSRSVFTLFGKESFIVYVVHLLVVYGYTYEWSFIRFFGPHMNYFECAGLFFVLVAAMWALAFVWHWMKQWNMRISKLVQFAALAAIVLTFIFKTT